MMSLRRQIPGLRPPAPVRHEDPDLDGALADHRMVIAAMLDLPTMRARVLDRVELASATNVLVAHGLGRAPLWVRPSCPRSADGTVLTSGEIQEIRDTSTDRERYIVLRATGYGAPVLVDVLVL